MSTPPLRMEDQVSLAALIRNLQLTVIEAVERLSRTDEIQHAECRVGILLLDHVSGDHFRSSIQRFDPYNQITVDVIQAAKDLVPTKNEKDLLLMGLAKRLILRRETEINIA